MKYRLKKEPLRKLIPPVLILLFFYFGFMTVYTFANDATAPAGEKTVMRQIIKYDYQVDPVDSILYPAGTEPLPSGSESYFSALTEKITVQVTGEIIADEAGSAEGDLQIKLMLRSPGQWEKELPFELEITSSRKGNGILTFSAAFDLPLETAEELAEAIIQEVQVRPREGLALVISSMLVPKAAGVNNTIPVKPLQGEFLFTLDGPLIMPQANQQFEEVTLDSTTSGAQPQYVRLFGLPVTVSAGRLLFPFLSLLVILASGGYYMEVLRNNDRPAKTKKQHELEKIRKKFGSRLVRAEVIRDTGSIFKVEVDEYKELARLADELEKPIIEVISSKDRDNPLAGYFVLDGENLYYFRLKERQQD